MFRHRIEEQKYDQLFCPNVGTPHYLVCRYWNNFCEDGEGDLLGKSVCDVGTVGKISDCQPEGPRFNPRPG